MDSINFKATFVSKSNIKVLDENGQFKDKTVNFVKRNPYSKLDYNSICTISDLWSGSRHNFVKSMLHHSDIIRDDEKSDVYFLTEQENNFRKIVPEKVLGMVEVTKHNNFSRINFIQTRDDNIFQNKSRTQKGIGQAMMDMVKVIYGGKDVILNAVRTAIGFYEKNGFVVTYKRCSNPQMVLKALKK